ncbi:MAG: hypothetical protein KC561_08840, partial [Myxococcales bacterium]|nr:hypothetical protein [Myxococcales bacterium]
MSALLILCCVLFLAFFVEAAMGFGSVLVATAAGSFFFDITEILPLLLTLGCVSSGYITVRYWKDVELSRLLKTVLPAMALGL